MRRTIIWAVVTVAAVSLLASVNIYYVRSGADGDLLWNAHEAYLFLKVYRLGWRLTYLQYFGEALKRLFGVATPFVDKRASTIVVRLSPEVVEDYAVEDPSFDIYTPYERSIYANHEGELWKWSATHFEPASTEEQQVFKSAQHSFAPDFDNVNGWSKRCCVLSRGSGSFKFDVSVGGKMFSLVANRTASNRVSIDLVRAGQVPQTIWYLDEKQHNVSNGEYEKLFEGH